MNKLSFAVRWGHPRTRMFFGDTRTKKERPKQIWLAPTPAMERITAVDGHVVGAVPIKV
jgi:hypothetical protein